MQKEIEQNKESIFRYYSSLQESMSTEEFRATIEDGFIMFSDIAIKGGEYKFPYHQLNQIEICRQFLKGGFF